MLPTWILQYIGKLLKLHKPNVYLLIVALARFYETERSISNVQFTTQVFKNKAGLFERDWIKKCSLLNITTWKVSKYEVFCGRYFPVFSPNTGKYGPEKTPYMATFHAVHCLMFLLCFLSFLLYNKYGVFIIVKSIEFPTTVLLVRSKQGECQQQCINSSIYDETSLRKCNI